MRKPKPARSPSEPRARDLAQNLRKAGLKATRPRITILHFLFHNHGPFTIDEMRQEQGRKALDVTTLYRTTTILERAGLVDRCDFGDGLARFEFHHPADSSRHHHHIVCKICRCVLEVNFCLSKAWQKVLVQMGYTDLSHTLEFFGKCRKCQQTARA